MNEERGISVITPTARIENVENLINNFLRQKYKSKELIIIINDDTIPVKVYEGYGEKIKIYKMSQTLCLADYLNFAIEQTTYSYVARFDDDDYYGENYLEEVDECFRTKACDIVNKGSIYCYFKEIKTLILRGVGKENRYNLEGGGATICFKKDVYKAVKFKDDPHEDSVFIADCRKAGYSIYSCSQYNFLVLRSVDYSNHRYKRAYEFFITRPRVNIISENISLKEACKIVNQKSV